MTPHPSGRYGLFRGFSLIELLVVIAIIALLMTLGTLGFNSVAQGSAVTRTGQEIADTIVLARQHTLSRNRRAEVRFLKLPAQVGGDIRYRGVQAWVIKDDAGTMEPISRVFTFPNNVVVSDSSSLSPLLTAASALTGTLTNAGTARNYTAFAIESNGSLGTSAQTNSFLTVVGERDATATEPANFSSIYINPVTGEVSTFRP